MVRLLVLAALLAVAPVAAVPATSPVVLLHHPFDQVDPFGVPFGSGDTFSSRYGAVAAQTGRFDFPVFVADGLGPIQQLPDPKRPFEGTLEAYAAAAQERAGHEAPVALALKASDDGGRATVMVRSHASGVVQDPQGQPIHLWLAVVEDAIHYQPPAPVSNGVTDHRFTVRSLVDEGAVPLTSWDRTFTLALPGGWAREHLSVAAWLQAGPVAGRFQPSEVVQVVSAPLDGVERLQSGKGVLLEGYSATWCAPCLYGDLALERLAIQSGAAQPLVPVGATYWKAPSQPVLILGLAVVAGGVGFVAARRRP